MADNASFDFNYSDDALEVKNDSDRIVLQLRLLPNRVQVQGAAWIPMYRALRLVAVHDPKTGAMRGAFVLFSAPGDREEPHIKPLFK